MPAQGNAGYSLIELLVAMTLFALAALGLSTSVAMVLRSSVASDDLTQATLLAQEKLEELSAPGGLLTDGADTPATGFTRVWTVTSDDPDPGVTRVDVSVSWDKDAPQTVALATVVND